MNHSTAFVACDKSACEKPSFQGISITQELPFTSGTIHTRHVWTTVIPAARPTFRPITFHNVSSSIARSCFTTAVCVATTASVAASGKESVDEKSGVFNRKSTCGTHTAVF